MNNILGKLVLVGLLVALCLWSVIPPDQKIRLGKDLQGGVSLVYAVKIADDAEFRIPATIDDPAILDEIRAAVRPMGYGGA